MLRTSIALASLALLPGCFLGGSKEAPPYYQTSNIRIFKTTPDATPKKGGYTFGGLRIEGVARKKQSPGFVLLMESGRDQNQNGLLEKTELIDTERIQDGTLPFTFQVAPQTIPPGPGQAIHQIRIEFTDRDPFRFERKEPGRVVEG